MCGGGLGVGVNLHSCAGVRPSGSYQLAARAATASDSRACGRLVEPELALVRRILHDIEAEAAWLGARALGIRLHDVLPGWRKRDDATVGWMALRRDWACHELAEPLRLHFHLDEDRDHLRHGSIGTRHDGSTDGVQAHVSERQGANAGQSHLRKRLSCCVSGPPGTREPNVPVDANNADVIRGVFMMLRSSMISTIASWARAGVQRAARTTAPYPSSNQYSLVCRI